jgi:hypothetical protein
MKKRMKTLWLGFLDAGERSSPVVRDPTLDTGNPATIYLFNLMRGRILEYRKDIVELKLREFLPQESSMVKALRDAFQLARKDFTPRGGQRCMSSSPRRPTQRQAPEFPEIPEVGDDDDAWTPLDEDARGLFSEELPD